MTRSLAVVTTNPGKLESFRHRLGAHRVEAVALDLIEPQHLDVAEVARDKAAQAYAILHRPLVVEDGGLVVPALGDWPGAYTKPFLETVGTDGLLRLLGVADPAAHFHSAIIYQDERGVVTFAGPSRRGRLVAPRGELPDQAWSSLWQVFVPDGEGRTLAEMGTDAVRAARVEDAPIERFARWWHARHSSPVRV